MSEEHLESCWHEAECLQTEWFPSIEGTYGICVVRFPHSHHVGLLGCVVKGESLKMDIQQILTYGSAINPAQLKNLLNTLDKS